MNFWDQNYAAPGYKYGTTANAFLRDQASRLPPGAQVLLPGDGEGRNGVWLAQQGHRVHAVDGSAVGVAKARALAAERGVALRIEHGELADWQPAPASADAVVLTFVHLPPALRAQTHRRAAQALRPGGWLILEAFHPLQLNHRSGGPKDAAMLYTLASLREDFAGLQTVQAWEGEVRLDEGPGHQGLAHVTRWVGQAVQEAA